MVLGANPSPRSQAERVRCPWRSQCFLRPEHRPEAGTELLRLEEAHPKWKPARTFYLGSLGAAGPAARAGFTWLVSRNLVCSGASGASGEPAQLLRTAWRTAGHGAIACGSGGGGFDLVLREAGEGRQLEPQRGRGLSLLSPPVQGWPGTALPAGWSLSCKPCRGPTAVPSPREEAVG